MTGTHDPRRRRRRDTGDGYFAAVNFRKMRLAGFGNARLESADLRGTGR